MSDAAQNLDQEEGVQSAEETKAEDNKPSYEELQKRLESVLSKHDELLTETKKAKADKRKLTEAQAEQERKNAEKNGEFEKLWKSAQDELQKEREARLQLVNANRQDRLSATAMKMAAELADGHNVELLSDFIIKKLENVSEDSGVVSDDVYQAVSSGFKNNEKFKSLLRGNKATGGGAPGNMRGAQDKQSLTRAEFSKLTPVKQAEYAQKVGAGSAELLD